MTERLEKWVKTTNKKIEKIVSVNARSVARFRQSGTFVGGSSDGAAKAENENSVRQGSSLARDRPRLCPLGTGSKDNLSIVKVWNPAAAFSASLCHVGEELHKDTRRSERRAGDKGRKTHKVAAAAMPSERQGIKPARHLLRKFPRGPSRHCKQSDGSAI